MKYTINILVIACCVFLIGCKDWDEHYNTSPTGSNENVWDALQKEPSVSSFVDYLKQHQFDTLFATNNTYTVFAPTNDAFTQFLNTGDSVTENLLAYHISKYFIQTPAISGKRKIQTFAEKYALFDNTGDHSYLDDILLTFESPLYKNGKYFIMGQVAKPKPNLYEYIALTNKVLKAYIDSEDSVILDKERSTPIGFDDNGNTIYDTVADIINMFELKYFEVSEEFRNKTATIVFPKDSNYNAALTAMAQSISAGYVDYRDIPMDWQNKVLIPYLLEHGVFENMLEREEFLKKTIKDTVKLKNILGDSVVIDYEPGEKTICSNGFAYNYYEFKVPDTLYKAPVRYEAEWTLKTAGSSFTWYPGVQAVMSTLFPGFKDFVRTASNDTVMRVSFTSGYSGTFSLSFNIKNLFPRKYLAVFRIATGKGGIYDLYMNDVFLRRFDYGTDISSSGYINSVIPGKRYYPQSSSAGYNRFDCWVNNLEIYGTARLKLVYRGPGTLTNNGITLDYVEFIPY